MNYKDKFYSKYVSTHSAHLYGEARLEDIKKTISGLAEIFWSVFAGR